MTAPAPGPARRPRRRRPAPARLAVQGTVVALALWAITHPRSPLALEGERATLADSLARADSLASARVRDSLAALRTPAPPVDGGAATALAPPALAPPGPGGLPYSPHTDAGAPAPARPRLGRADTRRPPWLAGRDSAPPRRPWSVPRLRTLAGVRLFASVEERARGGERIAVTITAYCLQGRTRRGNWVRDGIVAADPRLFPLGRELELWIGRRSAGRHLIDDTGSAIKGAKLDLWMGDCREAIRFGRRRGYAQLVPRR